MWTIQSVNSSSVRILILVFSGEKGRSYIGAGLRCCDVSGTVQVGIVCTLCVPCMLHTKHVQPDDGLLIKSKHVAPLNTYILNLLFF
jgi:hypothetical protein